MVKKALGAAGGDMGIGTEIVVRTALSQEFENASGKHFDNDAGALRGASPHADALGIT